MVDVMVHEDQPWLSAHQAAFIKRHQGSIWVESEEGQGTTVSCSLPLYHSPEE